VEKPSRKDDEVLLEVRAASVNYGDWALLSGKPFVVRLIGGGQYIRGRSARSQRERESAET
jgi:NADPH:quinone reductase-like Zn-dependent oxidoreductase